MQNKSTLLNIIIITIIIIDGQDCYYFVLPDMDTCDEGVILTCYRLGVCLFVWLGTMCSYICFLTQLNK